MRVNELATRAELISTPLPVWENTYTPIPNGEIFSKIDENIRGGGLKIVNEEYRVSRSQSGIIKGVIGSIDLASENEEFGRRIMFRNSYDKSMSFAFLEGLCCWICSNGAIKSDEMQFKRVHKGTAFDDAMVSIDDGFNRIDVEFKKIVEDMNAFKECHVDKELMYELVGNLFFEQGVLSSVQLNIVKDQLDKSDKFKHLIDPEFSAFDMYNHITESLKRSAPIKYVQDHVATHKLFESKFIKTEDPVQIITPELV